MNDHQLKIESNEQDAGTIMQNSLDHARKIGLILRRVKKLLPHGQFQPWLEKGFRGGASTARAYKQIAENWEEIARHKGKKGKARQISIREALKHLNNRWTDIEHPHCMEPLIDCFEKMINKWPGHVCDLLAKKWSSIEKTIRKTLWKHYEAKHAERIEARRAGKVIPLRKQLEA